MDTTNDKEQPGQDSTTIGESLINPDDMTCEIEATEENMEWIGEAMPRLIEAE